jgi:hypothetical protein
VFKNGASVSLNAIFVPKVETTDLRFPLLLKTWPKNIRRTFGLNNNRT